MLFYPFLNTLLHMKIVIFIACNIWLSLMHGNLIFRSAHILGARPWWTTLFFHAACVEVVKLMVNLHLFKLTNSDRLCLDTNHKQVESFPEWELFISPFIWCTVKKIRVTKGGILLWNSSTPNTYWHSSLILFGAEK